MSNFCRWRILTRMRLLIWESSVSPASLPTRRAGVLGLLLAVPSSLVSLSFGVVVGALSCAAAAVLNRKKSFVEELKRLLLLYIPLDPEGYYQLLANVAIGKCTSQMLSIWIQSELKLLRLQRGNP